MLRKIKELVQDSGTGFLMLGCDAGFGPSWVGTEIAQLLPVEVPAAGRIEAPVKVVPTETGLRHFIMQLGARTSEVSETSEVLANTARWQRLPPLDGLVRLGKLKPRTMVFAQSADGVPILVGQEFDTYRTLAFAGDTTWGWLVPELTPEDLESHPRFWKQVVLWLAKQDKAEGSVWIRQGTRRLQAGRKLGFTMGLRGKTGMDVKDARFEAKVIGPNKSETVVPTSRDMNEERGVLLEDR